MDLVCLGELLVDLFPAESGRKIAEVSAFLPKPGGAPANVAVAARRLGLESAFIGKVGDEAFGRWLAEVLKEQGVETQGIRFDPAVRTTLAFIAMPDENTAEFVFYRNPGADLRLSSDELDRTLLEKTRAFHYGSLSLVDEPARSATHTAVKIARKSGALISFDVNYRPTLWQDPAEALQQITDLIPHTHLLKVNEIELRLLTEDGQEHLAGKEHLAGQEHRGDDPEIAGKMLLERGPELVAITLGSKGSFYCTEKACGFVPAFKVKTIDATGCGDAFIAGLISQLLQEANWRIQLTAERLAKGFRYANAVGALTALKKGVIPALPTAAQVDTFLKTREIL